MHSDGRRSRVSLFTCPGQAGSSETVELFASLSRERKSRGHAPSPRGRNRGMSTGTPPPASSANTHIFLLFYIIDRRRGPRPRRSEVSADCRQQPRTVASVYDDNNIPWPHSRVTSRACVPFCR
ncbi:Uncharacterized protein FWK35_00005438 [Aphis craccivora]|uniref:Uncharacterized protein n=1 Tax=Aphis craccivora TaxID=307492 RepID=A0A6G0Z982_APHCR|nr:Uncharacterized protein FWK35_00005438 [Aphis craccivora]